MRNPSRKSRWSHWLPLLLILVSVTVASANVRFFLQVMRNLQHYRVTGDQVSLDLHDKGTSDFSFHLSLPSRRGNQDEVLMAGYLSSAYAIDRTGMLVNSVHINLILVSDNNRVVATSALASDLALLVSKELDPHSFLGRITRIN